MALTATLSIEAPLAVVASNSFQSVSYEAVDAGAAGNSISIELVDPDDTDQDLVISVEDNAISVSLATDEDGVITTDSDELAAALNDDEDASALIEATADVANVVQAPQDPTYLVGGEDQAPPANQAVRFVLTVSNSGAATTLSNIKPIAKNVDADQALMRMSWSAEDQSNFFNAVLPASGSLVVKFQANFHVPGDYSVDCVCSSPGVPDFKVTTPVEIVISDTMSIGQ